MTSSVSFQLLADMSRMQKRVKTELQESTRDFQRQLSELNVRIKSLLLKEEWLVAEHLKEDNGDSVLIEHVEAAKKRCVLGLYFMLLELAAEDLS